MNEYVVVQLVVQYTCLDQSGMRVMHTGSMALHKTHETSAYRTPRAHGGRTCDQEDIL